MWFAGLTEAVRIVAGWLRDVPLWIWLTLAAAGLIWWQTHALHTERTAHQHTRQQHAQVLAGIAAKTAAAERAQRQLEQARINEIQSIERDTHDRIAQIRADADRAAALSLRQPAQQLAQRARAACPNPAAASSGPPAGDPIGVLADVLSRADERAGELARIADERGTAGAACERAYDALTQ